MSRPDGKSSLASAGGNDRSQGIELESLIVDVIHRTARELDQLCTVSAVPTGYIGTKAGILNDQIEPGIPLDFEGVQSPGLVTCSSNALLLDHE